jgi:hypothetical protein
MKLFDWLERARAGSGRSFLRLRISRNESSNQQDETENS